VRARLPGGLIERPDAHGAGKAALNFLTRTRVVELGASGVRVVGLAPRHGHRPGHLRRPDGPGPRAATAPPVRLEHLYATEEVKLAGQHIVADESIVVLAKTANRLRGHRTVQAPPVRLADCPRVAPVEAVARSLAEQALDALLADMLYLRRTGPILRRPRAVVTGGVLRFPVAGHVVPGPHENGGTDMNSTEGARLVTTCRVCGHED